MRNINGTHASPRGHRPGPSWDRIIPVFATMLSLPAAEASSFVLDAAERERIEQSVPEKATVQPARPRRLLIFTRNVGYGGHKSIAHASEAFTRMGERTGAFEATVSADPAVFQREALRDFDAVFLNNTIGNCFTNADLRLNLLEFVTGGGGLMGVHGTSIAFMHWKWPPVEDWPEFGCMIGARGAFHRDASERARIKVDDADHPLNRAFAGQGFEMTEEFFRFHEPYSRQRVRVLLSMDTAKTDRSGVKPTMIGPEFSHNFTGSMPDVKKCVAFFNATALKLGAESRAKP